MAENYPWDSTHKTQYSSPLQSGSSQSSQEPATAAVTVRETQQQQQQQPRPTLVETLQTCLATAVPTTQPGRSLSDPSGGVTAAATVRQSRSSGALSGSTAPSTVGMKRRSRTSRRIPTTVVEATSSDFKETVHRLTGIAPPAPQPVRPQPKRAAPATFIRPSAAVPNSSPQLLDSLLNVTAGAPAVHPAFWHQLQQRMGAPSSPQLPHFDPFIKNEEIGAPSSTWWDAATPQSYGLMNPTTSGAFDGSTSSGGRTLEDDPEFSMDDPDLSWFQHDHSGSDYMR